MYHFTCVFLVEQLIANGTFNISVSSQGSEGKEKLLQNSIYGQFFHMRIMLITVFCQSRPKREKDIIPMLSEKEAQLS